jgi:26S proteasome regulatory subunit N10
MPKEAVVLLLDNSEFSRNGDFAPCRWDSQVEAAGNICDAKLGQNPESSLGVMTMAGTHVEVKLTQTTDIEVLRDSIGHIEISKPNQIFNNLQTALQNSSLQ